jgi:4'-phosphopantetheinyl transferase
MVASVRLASASDQTRFRRIYGICDIRAHTLNLAFSGRSIYMTSAGSFPPEWQTSPQNLSLLHDEVHVWAASLNQPSLVVSRMLWELSQGERARAGHFHALKDRNRYVVAHSVLREILGRYLNLAPAEVRLCALHDGKPALAPELRGDQLEFNLSHSHEVALIAVGKGRRIGIDVEYIRAELLGEEIAERFFSPLEAALLRSLPQGVRLAAFFTGWTRKEAYIKARGVGLRKPLDQFAVVIAPGQPAALLHDEADPHAALRWSLRSLDVGQEYAASVAVEGQDWCMCGWLWQEPIHPH